MNEIGKTLLAAGMAKGVSDLFVYPLEFVKTKIQMKKPLELSFLETFRGVGWSLACALPAAGGFWGGFGAFKTVFSEEGLIWDLFAVIFANFCCCLVKCPFEMLKIQTISGKLKDFWDAPVLVIQKSGLVGCYVGFLTLVCREVMFDLIQMMAFSLFSSFWLLSLPFGPFQPSACFAFILAGFITTPLDVIKTKMMMDNEKFQSLSQSLKSINAAEGLFGLFSGWKPRLLCTALGWWIFFAIFNLTMEVLG